MRRISVLSEIPHIWRTAVNRWARLNRRHRREVDGRPAPCRNDEYLFYQTLVGVWPLAPPHGKEFDELRDRLRAYMEKATREAKLHTSWINPEFRVRRRCPRVRDCRARRPAEEPLPGGFGPLSPTGRQLGALHRAGRTIPEAHLPRRAGHLSRARAMGFQPGRPGQPPAGGLRAPEGDAGSTSGDCRWGRSVAALARPRARPKPRDPRLKLFLTWRTLQLRRQRADLFRFGQYVPLEVQGAEAKHVCAFARHSIAAAEFERSVAIVVVPRWIAQLTPLPPDALAAPPPMGHAVWGDTRVMMSQAAPVALKNWFTGRICPSPNGSLAMGDVLSDFPVALLSNVVGG